MVFVIDEILINEMKMEIILQFDNLKWLGLDWDESVDKDNGYGTNNPVNLTYEQIYQRLKKISY
ncbi:hypothetical protein ACVPOQ_11470 [Staphylococcus aureus]